MQSGNDVTQKVNRADFSVGSTVFGRFEILKVIAEGGKGRVFEAKNVSLQNVVALKVLIPNSISEEDLIRFQTEARLAAMLNHPNIAAIYDFGVYESKPYLAMELVRGESLKDRVDRAGPLSLHDFVRIFIQVARALIHAHEIGIIHRDVKPANIVTFDDKANGLVAKILDFGIAKRIELNAEEYGRLTATGRVIGSPLFMSPEQTRAEQLTPASDGYSLGCTMWMTLVGKPPLSGDTVMKTLMMHQSEVPDSIDTHVGNLPPELIDTIDGLLKKDRAERPHLQDVLNVLESLSIEEVPLVTEEPDSPLLGPEKHRSSFGMRQKIFALSAASIVLFWLVIVIVFRGDKGPSRARVEFDGVVNTRDALTDKALESKIGKASGEHSTSKLNGVGSHTKNVELKGTLTAEMLSTIKKYSSAQTLELSENGELFAAALKAVSSMKSLRQLVIQGNSFEHVDVSPLLAHKSLQYLNVSGTDIDEQILRKLASIPSLRELIIDRCPAVRSEVAKRLSREFRHISFVPDPYAITDPSVSVKLRQFDLASQRQDHKRVVTLGPWLVERYIKQIGATSPKLIEAYKVIGSSCYVLGRFSDSANWLQKALEIDSLLGFASDEIAIRDGIVHAKVAESKSHITNEIIRLLDAGDRVANQAFPGSTLMAERCVFRGDLYRASGDMKTAMKCYRKCLTSLQSVTDESNDFLPKARALRGQGLVHLGVTQIQIHNTTDGLKNCEEGFRLLEAERDIKTAVGASAFAAHSIVIEVYLAQHDLRNAARIRDSGELFARRFQVSAQDFAKFTAQKQLLAQLIKQQARS